MQTDVSFCSQKWSGCMDEIFFFCAFLPPLWNFFFFILYCLKFFSPFKCAPLIYSSLFVPSPLKVSFSPSLPLSPFSFTLFLLSVGSFHIILSLLRLPASPSSFPLLFSLWDRYISWKGVLFRMYLPRGSYLMKKIGFPSHVPIPLKPYAISANSFA